MTKYSVTKAWLNRPTLKFQQGAWFGKGRFKLSSGTRGRFEVKFFNGYRQEFFITFHPESFKNIRQQTFDKYEREFQGQVIDFIKPSIEETLKVIREEEMKSPNPKIQITKTHNEKGRILVAFTIGDNPQKSLLLQKIEDDNWEFNTLSLQDVATGVTSSTWLQEIWQLAQEHEELKLPLLF